MSTKKHFCTTHAHAKLCTDATLDTLRSAADSALLRCNGTVVMVRTPFLAGRAGTRRNLRVAHTAGGSIWLQRIRIGRREFGMGTCSRRAPRTAYFRRVHRWEPGKVRRSDHNRCWRLQWLEWTALGAQAHHHALKVTAQHARVPGARRDTKGGLCRRLELPRRPTNLPSAEVVGLL